MSEKYGVADLTYGRGTFMGQSGGGRLMMEDGNVVDPGFAGGRTTAGPHLPKILAEDHSVDTVAEGVDGDIGTACPESVPRSKNFGHPPGSED